MANIPDNLTPAGGGLAQGAAGHASDLGEMAGNAAGAAGNLAGNALGSVTGAAGDALASAGKLADNLTGSLSSAASGALGGLMDAFTDIVDNTFGGLLAAFANAFQQSNRLIKLQLGTGEARRPEFLPQTATGTESLSALYHYEVICLASNAALALKPLLGLPARLSILTGAGGIADKLLSMGAQKNVVRCGIVTRVEALPADGGFAQYKLTLEPPLALLRHRHTSRVFQDMSVPRIIETLLGEHLRDNPVIAATFAWRFEIAADKYPDRSYCLQYRETDLAFIERLLFEEGMTYRFEHDSGGSSSEDSAEGEGGIPHVTLIIFDDPYNLPQATQGTIRFHRASATEASDTLTGWTRQRQIGVEKTTLASFDYQPVLTHTGEDEAPFEQDTLAAEAGLEDYDAQTLYYAADADELTRYARRRQAVRDRQKQALHGAGNVRQLKAGDWFELAEHPAYEMRPSKDRRFAVTKLAFTAHSNLQNDVLKYLAPQKAPAPPPYRIDIETQPLGVALHPAYAHTKHAKPTARGKQSATVVGPKNEHEVFTDEQGRIKVQFHWQRDKEHPAHLGVGGANFDDRSSCWLRVAYPSAGADWGHQFIPRIGQEVLIDFLEEDIDRPIVTGVVYNGRHSPPWFSGAGQLPLNKTLSGIKTKEHDGVQYNELLFDDTPNEVRAKLSSEHGKTQLNQGYLIHPRTDGAGEARGEGFELRTDLSGALRAGRGILVSAHERKLAAGNQLDREEMIAQLESALAIAKSLGDDAEANGADGTDIEAQQNLNDRVQHWEGGSNTGLGDEAPGKGIVAVGAPQGIAIGTEANINLATGESLDWVSLKDTNHTVGQNWRVRAARSLSFFVQQLGMKLIAAAGKIHIKALSDEIEIAAQKRLHLFSLEEIVLDAPKITLRAQGAGVEYGGGITSRTTGTHVRHAASHADTGPASVTPEGALSATREQFDQKVLLHWTGSGSPIKNRRYRLTTEDGRVFEGVTDDNGNARQLQSEISFARYDVELLPDDVPAVAPSAPGAGASSSSSSAHAGQPQAEAPTENTAQTPSPEAASPLDAATEAAGSAQDAASNVVGSAVDAAKEVAGHAVGAVSGLTDAVTGAAGAAVGAVQDVAGAALGAASGMAGSMTGATGSALDNVTGMAGSTADATLGAAKDAAGSALSGVLPEKPPV